MLTAALTLPSPDVSARSANDGPNVVAVRACSPVLGSSLNTNPPDDVPSGPDVTSSDVASEMAEAAAGDPVGPISWNSVSRSVRFGVTVVACANTDAGRASANSVNTTTRRFMG